MSGQGRRRLAAIAATGVALVAGGCNTKPLESSPCGSVATVSPLPPLMLAITGSFPLTGSTQLILVVTTGPSVTRQFPSTNMTSSSAVVPLTSLPLLPSGTYGAMWIMAGCGSADQTQIFGPDSITVTQ
jgi:hypothetical protein